MVRWVPPMASEDNELVEGLTADELKELSDEIRNFDPDDELLSAADRVPDQTDKEPTGPYDRQHLLDHMKQEALESEVGNDWVPYEKKTRGKVWKSKERKRDAAPMLPDELSDVLDDASEEDLLELAAVLGIHGMLTSKQSQQVEADKAWESLKGSGLRKLKPGITKATKSREYTDIHAINELDLEKALDRIRSGDETLTELNLNNHKDVTDEKLLFIAGKLKTNRTLKTLYLANTRMGDIVCKAFAEALQVNSVLETLNMESNFLTRDGVHALLQMLHKNTSLRELKLANQAQAMGHQLEVAVCKALAKNHTLLRFGFSFESRGPRHTAYKHLIRNNDAAREKRMEGLNPSVNENGER